MKRTIVFLLAAIAFKTGMAQVNLPTGSATFSLPIFNWQDDKSRLNTGISLNYNSGNGLKVNDVASNIGQGWNLVAGGVITRIQAGEPDDQKEYHNGTTEQLDDLTKYPAGYLYDPAVAACPNSLVNYPIFKDKNHLYKQHNVVAADKEMDRFAFQFNGRSGMFIAPKNADDQCYFLGDTKLKAWYERDENLTGENIRTTIKTFYIQDENGLVYKFSLHDKVKVTKFNYCDPEATAAQTQPEFKAGNVYHEASFDDNDLQNPFIITGWYLTEIRDPLTQRVITFNYEIRSIVADAGTSFSYYNGKDYAIVSHATSKTFTPFITSISYPDGHQVAFNYGNMRVDLPGDFVMSSIDVKYQGRYLSKYQFNTSYVILSRMGTPAGDFEHKAARLYLQSLQKYGIDLKSYDPPYKFDYYLGTGVGDNIVPPPFFHIKDNWGFYNGNNNTPSNASASIDIWKKISELSVHDIIGLCFLHDNVTGIMLKAKDGYAKNGLLKQITYPSGGTLAYEYAQNYGVISGQSQSSMVGGVHVSVTKVTDGGYSNDCNHPLVTNYSYTTATGGSSLWGLEMPLNSITVKSHYEPASKYFYYRPPLSMGCDYRYQYPGILAREQAISLTSLQQFLTVLVQVLDIVSGVMEIIDVVSLCLKATPAAWVAVIIDIIGSVVNIIISCSDDKSDDSSIDIYYNTAMNASNPLPTQFNRVEVTEGDGSNGKTISEFTAPGIGLGAAFDYWVPDNSKTYSMEQRYPYWAYGLPLRTTVKSSQDVPIKETEYEYYTNDMKNLIAVKNKFFFNSCKCLVTNSTSQRSDDWSIPMAYNDPNGYTSDNISAVNAPLYARQYFFYTGRAPLHFVRERVFKQNNAGQRLETTTEYKYLNLNYQANEIITTQSNGDINSKRIFYSVDNVYADAIRPVMQENNIVNDPVGTTESVSKSSAPNVTLNTVETAIEFTQLATGAIKPSKTLVKRYTQPGTAASSSFAETQSYTYDAAGNLVGSKDEGGRFVHNIYDYDDKYITATVINADALLDKSAYTSFETLNLGGWTSSGTPFILSQVSAVTGKITATLIGGSHLSANINPLKAYTVSFWSTLGSVVASPGTLVKSAPTINGFTYYEYSIPLGTTSVSVTGTGRIDEVRLYPQNARMQTATYDPLIGKTSECNVNNRITYFEYDEYARIKYIKDDNRNIIKMYEYNITANRPGPCNITYYNTAITEYFMSQNCSAGYTPVKYAYTVPANKYSSTISQEAADQQAENELATLAQPAANSNGGCTQIWYNDQKSQAFTKQGCVEGTAGTAYVYIVPANRYSSTISLQDANQKALDEIAANGQSMANRPGYTSCVFSTDPLWIGTGLEQCQGGHRWKQVKDTNPNSSSYNQTQYVDYGADVSCPPPACDNCTFPNRCVGTECVLGIKIYTTSHQLQDGSWECTYHYEWNGLPPSQDYTEIQFGGGCIYQDN